MDDALGGDLDRQQDRMATQLQRYVTPEEYLARERISPDRSEYIDGRILAMVGGSRLHNLVAAAVQNLLTAALEGRPCEVYQSDMRVRVDAARMYAYPDVVAVCGTPEFDGDVLLNPTVIVEVLSDSTEHYDRGAKSLRYRRLPSLGDYVLVAQDQPRVEHFARRGDGWLVHDHDDLDAVLELPSIGVSLPLREIYRRALPLWR